MQQDALGHDRGQQDSCVASGSHCATLGFSNANVIAGRTSAASAHWPSLGRVAGRVLCCCVSVLHAMLER